MLIFKDHLKSFIRRGLDKGFFKFFSPLTFRTSSSLDALEEATNSLVEGKLRFKKFPLKTCVIMSNLVNGNWHKCLYVPLFMFKEKAVLISKYYKPVKCFAWMLIDVTETRNAMVYVNFNELIMQRHNIPRPKIYIRHRNFIPTHLNLPLSLYVKHYEDFVNYIKRKFFEILFKFNLLSPLRVDTFRKNLNLSCTSLEHTIELVNFWIPQLIDIISNLRGSVKATYLSDNLTIYCNPHRKSSPYQLKIYQKSYNLLRVEITANRLKYLLDANRPEMLKNLFNHTFKQGLLDYGLNMAILEKSKKMKVPYPWLYDMIRKHLMLTGVEFAYLLINNCYVSNSTPSTQAMIKKMVRKKLIKKHHRGLYYPTTKLYEVKNLLFFVDPVNLCFNATQTKMFPFEYVLSFNETSFNHTVDKVAAFEMAKHFHDNFADRLEFHQR